MVTDREPIDRVIDFVIAVPVTTAIAIRRSAPLVVRASRRGVRQLTRRLAGVDRHRDTSPPAPRRVAGERSEGETPRDPVVAPPTARADPSSQTADDLPIEDYDHLAARQVVDRLASLEPDELAVIESYERAHRHRQTVLGRIGQLQS